MLMAVVFSIEAITVLFSVLSALSLYEPITQ